jgi:hypothetical protein
MPPPFPPSSMPPLLPLQDPVPFIGARSRAFPHLLSMLSRARRRQIRRQATSNTRTSSCQDPAPYAGIISTPRSTTPDPAPGKLLSLRWALIRKIYIILSLQLLLTIVVAAVVVVRSAPSRSSSFPQRWIRALHLPHHLPLHR